MNSNDSGVPAYSNPIWEDIVDDFLEIACVLSQEERHYLVSRLRKKKVRAREIQTHSGFSLAKNLVIVCRGMKARECWIYDPQKKKIAKFKTVPFRDCELS